MTSHKSLIFKCPSNMDSLMFIKVQPLSEDFSVLIMLAGFLFSVNSPMLNKVGDSMEYFPTFISLQ